MRADGRGLAWWWPAVPATGAALAAVGAITPELLGRAGLGVVAVAAVAACFLGLPLARADWARGPAEGWQDGLSSDLTDAAAVGTVGAAVSLCLPAGPEGWMSLAGVWAFALLAGRSGALLGAVVVGVLLLWSGVAVSASLGAAPWGHLEVAPHTWGGWLGTGVALGVLVGSGPGQWIRAASPAPGRIGATALSAGLGLGALIAAGVAVAADTERTFGGITPSTELARLVSVGAAAGALLVAGPPGDRPLRAVVGALATGWFTVSGPGAAAFWFGVTLPGLLGASCAVRAVRHRDVLQGVAAAALGGAVLLSFPALPELVIAAGALAVPAVVAVWVAGTRVLLGRAA